MPIQLKRGKPAFQHGMRRLRRLVLLTGIGVAHIALFAIFRPPLLVREPAEPPVVFTLSPPAVVDPLPRAVKRRIVERPQAPIPPRIVVPTLAGPVLHDLPPLVPAETVSAPLPAGDEDERFDHYRLQIEAIIAANRRYPAEAQRKRQAGAVEVAFAITGDGSVGPVSLVRSSRHKLLDREAIDLVRRCAPFPPPPSDLGPLRISLPVIFGLQEKDGA